MSAKIMPKVAGDGERSRAALAAADSKSLSDGCVAPEADVARGLEGPPL